MDLREWRKRIDATDEEILKLLNQRTEAVLEIGKLKAKNKANFYAPHREQAIINRLTATNPGPFPNKALRIVYKEIMSASVSLEKPIKVAYLGPEASNTHIATLKQFGSSVVYRPVRSQGGVLKEVETGRADYLSLIHI